MYATFDEIFGVVRFLRPDYVRENIDENLQFIAATDINTRLRRLGITAAGTAASDPDGFLKAAEICMYIEMSNMVRETETAFGSIGEERIGNYTKKYDTGMPMFFFSSGSSEPFLDLLQHESWRMRAFRYINDFISIYFTDEHGIRPEPYVLMARDSYGGIY